MSWIDEQHAANTAQRHTWRGVTQTHLDHLDALHADRHDREARATETVARTVSCTTCGRFNITPPCTTWAEADDHLDAIGWTHLDTRPLCPNCSHGAVA